jgi:heme o synthase
VQIAAGSVYGAAAAIFGAILVALALQLCRSSTPDRGAARRMCSFSILYLFVLFAPLLACNGSNPWSSILFTRRCPPAGSLQAETPLRPVSIARSSSSSTADEA